MREQNPRKGVRKGSGGGSSERRRHRRKLALWKRIAFPCVPVVLFLLLLEGALALLGVESQLSREDPFVGFVADVPLFVEGGGPDGQAVMATAVNKQSFFNPQRFWKKKPSNTYRIFTLGGSTTYGRPYADTTSFSGWLRELLPVADPSRRWEVINAGGISYASYRVARLMDELTAYDPDLFVIYTGHNEFLEERTYGELRRMPDAVGTLYLFLSHTRTWAAVNDLVDRLVPPKTAEHDARSILPREVQAKLDHSAGPALYERDDALRDGILTHYRISLERMVEKAHAVGAEVLFVTPASKLRGCTPFKTQSTEGLTVEQEARSKPFLNPAYEALADTDLTVTLARLNEALEFDRRDALLHYQRGMVLFALGREEEAEAALIRARDEDVCPLRALSQMRETVRDVARESNLPLVDFVELVRDWTREETGHAIPGEEFFLDHVHPTIRGHRKLAVALIDRLAEAGIVHPGADWNEETIAAVAERVEGSISARTHALALANLALTLDWAGKTEESQALASQALEAGIEEPTILMIAGRHAANSGHAEEALQYFRRALRANPGSPVIHSQLGMLHAGEKQYEAAAAHFFLASLIWNDNEVYHKQLAFVQRQRNRLRSALGSLLEAQALNPQDAQVASRIASIRSELGEGADGIGPAEFEVTRYPSGYPKTIAQTRRNEAGEIVPDGIWTEWFDGGGLRRFEDYLDGLPHGVSVTWDEDGNVVERRVVE